jgi:hypothetical protein
VISSKIFSLPHRLCNNHIYLKYNYSKINTLKLVVGAFELKFEVRIYFNNIVKYYIMFSLMAKSTLCALKRRPMAQTLGFAQFSQQLTMEQLN